MDEMHDFPVVSPVAQGGQLDESEQEPAGVHDYSVEDEIVVACADRRKVYRTVAVVSD